MQPPRARRGPRRLGAVDAVWHLGDVVGYGPEPDAVVERLAAVGALGRPWQPRCGGGRRSTRSSTSTPMPGRRWSGPVARIATATRDWLDGAARAARGATTSRSSTAARATRSGSTSRRRPSRVPDLAAISTTHGLHGHTHVPIAFAATDERLERDRPGGRLPVLELGDRRRCSTRAASASRATATRAPATWSSTRSTARRLAPRRLRHRCGPRPRCGPRVCRRGSPSGCAMASDAGSTVDRRPTATPGTQARRPARPRRAAPRTVFPVHRAGTADGQGGGQRADDADRARLMASIRGFFVRPAAGERGRARRAAGKKKALAIFSSDAISSSAYATEEILRVLILGGRGRAGVRPRDQHRDRGPAHRGRASATARSASPTRPAAARTRSRSGTSAGRSSLVAASALLIDYVMTVAVSTSSAVEQITSAFPALTTSGCIIGVVGDHPDHDRQPARAARGRQHLRGPDVPVPRVGAADDRGRGVPDRRARRAGESTPDLDRPDRSATVEPVTIAPAPAGVRGRRGGPDRDRGDRDRRARRSSRPNRRTRRRPWQSWPACSASCSSGSPSWPSTSGSPDRAARRSRRSSPRSRARSTATARSRSTCSRRSRRSCCSSPRTRASTPSRGSLAILAEDGFMPRQFAFRGDRLAFSYGIIVLATSRRPCRHLRAARPIADPALRGRRVHRLHDQPDRHDPALAPRAGARAGAGGSRSTRSARPDRDRRDRRDDRVKFVDGAAWSSCLIPVLVGMMCSSAASTTRRRVELERPRRLVVLPGPHREQRVVIPVNGINRAVVQAVNFGRSLTDDVRARLRHRRSRGRRGPARALGAPAARTCRSSSSSRRTAR